MRRPETQSAYENLIKEGHLENGCPLCASESLKEFQFWRIISNDFPYDKIAVDHHMIIPKRHVADSDVSAEEWEEYEALKKSYINDAYEFIIESTLKKRSVPEHFHLHLIVAGT